jgi:hypothetical protein
VQKALLKRNHEHFDWNFLDLFGRTFDVEETVSVHSNPTNLYPQTIHRKSQTHAKQTAMVWLANGNGKKVVYSFS